MKFCRYRTSAQQDSYGCVSQIRIIIDNNPPFDAAVEGMKSHMLAKQFNLHSYHYEILKIVVCIFREAVIL